MLNHILNMQMIVRQGADIAQLVIGVGGLVYGITSGAVAVTASYWNNIISLCFDVGDVAQLGTIYFERKKSS
ncbi:MAG TPA: hypothetical protein VD694_00265 [Nitrososphaeraceae archaeon]|nr:hypothetical protein [Nitrososphaeraceae archaeon]